MGSSTHRSTETLCSGFRHPVQHRDAMVGVRAHSAAETLWSGVQAPSCPFVICATHHLISLNLFAHTAGHTSLEDLAPEAVVVKVAY